MKSNSQPFYFSPHSLKSQKLEVSANPSIQSPYLRAVLSGKARNSSPARSADSNMAAALRYINNSR